MGSTKGPNTKTKAPERLIVCTDGHKPSIANWAEDFRKPCDVEYIRVDLAADTEQLVRLRVIAGRVLESERCSQPYCGDSGMYPRQLDYEGIAVEPEQCEFCYTNPKSRFNAATELRAALETSEIVTRDDLHSSPRRH